MKKILSRSQWITEEIQSLINGSVDYVILRLSSKEMRKIKKENDKIHYESREIPNRKKSDMRKSYKITLPKK